MHWLKACWIAFQFLTRIPVPAPETSTDEDHSKSLIFYPLVGLVIGLILLLLQFHSVKELIAVRPRSLILECFLAIGVL